MPFRSVAQAHYMYSEHPEIAKRWQKESPVDIKKLPERRTPTKGTKTLLSGKG